MLKNDSVSSIFFNGKISRFFQTSGMYKSQTSLPPGSYFSGSSISKYLTPFFKTRRGRLGVAAFTTISSILGYQRLNKETSSELHFQAEQKLLQKYIKTPYIQRYVDLDNGLRINTIASSDNDFEEGGIIKNKKPPLVLVHGWGAGGALFAKNFDQLAQHYTVYCIDMVGFGRSSHPKYTGNNPEDAVSFFEQPFHDWIQKMGLKNYSLIGHSFGGFLVCHYAMRYPNDISKLYLVAPVGIAEWKINIDDSLTKKFFAKLVWGPLGIVPQSILRGLGQVGISKSIWDSVGVRSHYRGLDKECWDYLYHNQMLPKSGDLAFLRILTKEGWAIPLHPLLHQIKMPMRVIYGERDYVRPEFGPKIVEAAVNSPKCDIVVLQTGHHVYFEDPYSFLNAIRNF